MKLQERLGIELPIVQAPMTGVQGSALAVAVCNAGGLGGPLRTKAEAAGSGDFSPLWSGQNPTGCKEIPAGQLTHANWPALSFKD